MPPRHADAAGRDPCTQPSDGSVTTLQQPVAIRAVSGRVRAPVATLGRMGPDIPSRPRVLLVDDDPRLIHIVSLYLQVQDLEVSTAGDGEQALEMLSRGLPDLLITDMMMPVMDGRQTIRALQRLDAGVPIVAVSGLAADGSPPDIATLGVQAFLPKPYTAASLLNTLHEVLGARRGRVLAGACECSGAEAASARESS